MKPVLILVDVQNDYLARSELQPSADELVPKIAELLQGFRARGMPVIHVQTLVRENGIDSMPHWRRQAIHQCIHGTSGALSPASLAPTSGEAIIGKQFFSGFESGELDSKLRASGVDTLFLAGLYTHGCIRATATDAYQKGFAVTIASDGIASYDALHALITREWFDGRAASFLTSREILDVIGVKRPVTDGTAGPIVPAAHIAGRWIDVPGLPTWNYSDPFDAERVIARVPVGDSALVARAVTAALSASKPWSVMAPADRAQALDAWAGAIEKQRLPWAELLAHQIGKPLNDGREEIDRALAHIRESARLVKAGTDETHTGAQTRHCRRGVVAVITPWNNPIAIPVAKIASALAFGNGVVWKPALPAPHVAMAIIASLEEAGISPPLSTIFGDAATARAIINHPDIAAVTITGSQRTGREAALLCARRAIPLQAELGGNNAAIVMADSDLAMVARNLARSAFAFAGQRCTATRRIIVDRAASVAFSELLAQECGRLRLGDPLAPETNVGPLISAERRHAVAAAIMRATTVDGGRLLCGGTLPAGPGNWYPPTLVTGLSSVAALVQEETFGPVAVIQEADGYDEAIRLCNGVPQGLVASFFGHDESLQRRFVVEAEAGILRLNPASFEIAADAPFGGWKSSGFGPPEHGRWDREVFARPQAIYGNIP